MAKSLQAIPKDLSLSDQQTFRVPLPKTPLEFTGERVTSLTQGEILHEHLHRYFFARQFCAGKRVLDIASGEGYGSALLASVSSSVVGIDVAAEAIQHAAENYTADNLSFLCGDTRRIPLAAGSVEVVVSFETIEHLGEQEEFIREIKRVLRPGGLLILSTPDREFFASSPPNPFHVKELSRADFQGLIGGHFKNSSFLAQSSVTGSVIVPRSDGKYEGFRRVHDNLYESAHGLPAAMYMIGVASDGPLPEMRAGSFDDREFQLALYAELQRRHIEILHREADVEALRGEKSASLAREAQHNAELNRLQKEQLRREEETESYRKGQEVASARATEAETELRQRREEKSQLERDVAAFETALREREAEARRNDEEMSRLRSGVTKLQEEKLVLRSEAEKLHTEIDHLRAGLRQRDDNVRRLEAEAASFKTRIGALQALESQARVEIQQLRHQHAHSEKEAANLIVQRDAYRRNVAEIREEMDAVKGSLSWTLSAPLRWLAKPAAGIRAAAMKAMYGTSAFQYTGKPLARLFSNVNAPGSRWLLPQNPLFDVEYYQRRYPDAARASKNSWAHYLAYGCDESRDPHPLFQSAYYNARNPDVAAAGVNPLIHYFEHGARENRDPNPNFDTSYYLQHYPDVKASGMNPLIHFMNHGEAEGRRTSGRQVEAVKAVQRVPMSQLPRDSEDISLPGTASQGPLISVLMPTFNTPPRYLRLAIDSVLRQSYQAWELCIYDDGSSSPETLETLREYRGRDRRIKIEFGNQNRGIATATNEAIALSQGQFITMLDHDDEIVPEALAEVANVLNSDSGIDALYTDQSYLEADGTIAEPFYKPDWSPDMFRGVMFIGHLLVVRRSLAVELGGFDARFDRVQDFEFMLRVSEKCGKIYHLPKILYYWRRIPGSVAFHGNEKGPIEPIQASAVNAHLKRMRIPAESEPHPSLAHRLVIKPAPRVSAPSVLIVVRDSSDPDACISSILERSSYSNFKVLTSRPPDPASHRVEAGNPAGPFGSDYVLWIDPDLEVVTPDWIEHLLLYSEQRQIACAAPLLVNRDGTVWHAGLVLGMNGLVGYPMQGLHADSDGYAGSLSCAREASCVSGECLMISRQKLDAMGGLVPFYQDPLYGGADLSLMASTAGLRNVVNPRAVLRRLAESRASDSSKLDRALFADRWSEITKYGDRYYNPNFIPTSPGYEPKKMAAATA
jgi:O-antigen biosynthesis protein